MVLEGVGAYNRGGEGWIGSGSTRWGRILAVMTTFLLLVLVVGQTDEVPVLEPIFQGAPGGEAPAGARRILVIPHEDRGFGLAGALRLRVEVGAAFLNEEYETDTPGVPTSRIDFVDDLGISSEAPLLRGDLAFRPFPHLGVRLGGSWGEWSGTAVTDSELRVGKIVLPPGSRTSSRFRLQDVYFNLDHDLGRGRRGYHGYRVGVRYFGTELVIRTTGGPGFRNRIGGVLPLLGYRGGVTPLDGLEVSGAFTFYPSLEYEESGEGGDKSQFLFGEIEVAVQFSPLPWLDLGGGYTFTEILLEKRRDGLEESVLVYTHVLGVWGRVRF